MTTGDRIEPDDPTARTVSARLRGLGHRVSWFAPHASLAGAVPTSSGGHAVGPGGHRHVAEVAAAEPDAEHRAALAESCGVDLEG